jgi:hypothetical protein
MNQEQQEKVHQLIQVLDNALGQAKCEVLDALSAVSVMSTSLAHSLGITRKEYMDNIEAMFDNIASQKQAIVQAEDENE